jgi:tyrosyl-tRNA synthetase
MPLLVGTDGVQKMSKSLDNYIAVDENPNDMYGKVLSIPDAIIINYFELLTDIPDKELDEYHKALDSNSVNPMELKKRLAREIVEQFHDKKAAADAQAHFEKTIQKKEIPDEIAEVEVSFQRAPSRIQTMVIDVPEKIDQTLKEVSQNPSHLLANLLANIGLAESKGDARRLIGQGAVKVDGEVTKKNTISLRDGMIIKVGKRRFVKIIDADKKA